MRLDVLTIFPEYLAPLDLSLIGKARRDGLLDLRVTDLRDFAHDRHRTVDDTPYGGGAGMVMKPEPWAEALDAVLAAAAPGTAPRLIVPGPGGVPFTQAAARRLAEEEHLVFACGRYEGIDERVYDHAREVFDGNVEIVSLGDYVLNGGEVAVLAMIEAIARLVPGVVGNAESLVEESHEDGLLEYPVYTKPASWRGREVPAVLLGGNHGAIAAWRHEQRLERTARRRPDLLPPSATLTGEAGLDLAAARPADAGEILTLALACGDDTVDDAAALAAEIHDATTATMWLARDAATSRLVGCVRGCLTSDGDDTTWLVDRLCVAPDLTHRGLRRPLWRTAISGAPTTVRTARLTAPRPVVDDAVGKGRGIRRRTGEDGLVHVTADLRIVRP